MKCFRNPTVLRTCPSLWRELRPFPWLEPRPQGRGSPIYTPWGGSPAHTPEGIPSKPWKRSPEPSEVSYLFRQAADSLGTQDPKPVEGDKGGSSGALTGGGVVPPLAFPGVLQLRGNQARQDRRGGHRHPRELLLLLGSPSPPTVGAGSPFLQESFGAEKRQKHIFWKSLSL